MLPLLGPVIDDQGIHADREKIRGIQDWPTPKWKNELQTFIGVVIYHAQFLAHLATANALQADRLSQNKFQWRPLHEEVFQQVKHLAKNINTLRPIDYPSGHPIYLSKNETLRQGRPMRLAHLAYITSIANQDATAI